MLASNPTTPSFSRNYTQVVSDEVQALQSGVFDSPENGQQSLRSEFKWILKMGDSFGMDSNLLPGTNPSVSIPCQQDSGDAYIGTGQPFKIARTESSPSESNVQNSFSSDLFKRGLRREDSGSKLTSDTTLLGFNYTCFFEATQSVGPVGVYPARPKGSERIREKLAEYKADRAEWPLTSCILDPIRTSVVCGGPAHILNLVKWFVDGPSVHGCTKKLKACRIKNKFCLDRAATVTSLLLIAN